MTEVNINLAGVLNGNTGGDVSVLGPRRRKSQLLIQGNKMSKLTSFIALAGLFFFPGPAPAAETERLRHYALGAIFKLSGRLKRK